VSRFGLLLAVLLGFAAPALAGPPDPLTDPRLAGVRAALATALDDVDRQGLPRELLVAKIREGLAKGVPAARILAVVQAMREGLGQHRARVRARLGPRILPPGLLRALLEAQQAGVPTAATDALLDGLGRRGPQGHESLRRATEVLTDLRLTGYPVDHALRVVMLVATREPGALGRVASEVDRLRRSEKLTAAEAIESVARHLERGDGLDRALRRASDDQAHGARGERGRATAPGGGKKPR
jgi:hypothetical protein